MEKNKKARNGENRGARKKLNRGVERLTGEKEL
jgi:hypothetical protein